MLTGASGFVGAHLLKALSLNQTFEIFCPYTNVHGGNIARVETLFDGEVPNNIKLFKHDLAKVPLSSVVELRGVNLIINLASGSHVDESIASPKLFVENNLALMQNILEYSRLNSDTIHLIHFSTDEVYGSVSQNLSNSEWERPHFPTNPYSASKSAQESLAISYCHTYRIPLAIINSTNIIGVAQNTEKFLPKVISSLVANKPVYVDMDSRGIIGSRKYIAVDDVIAAISLIMNQLQRKISSESNESPLNRYHISGIRQISNLELIDIVSNSLNKKATIEFRKSPRPSYDTEYNLTTNTMNQLGWKASIDPTEEILDIVDWTLAHPNWLNINRG